MTVNDIMLGDLVLLNSKPTRITITLLELIGELDYYGLVNGLEPIKLSTEFLKKNGFVQEDKNSWRIPGLKDNFRLFQWGNGSWSIEDHVLIQIEAVHELQRLLKMIGLEIELEL